MSAARRRGRRSWAVLLACCTAPVIGGCSRIERTGRAVAAPEVENMQTITTFLMFTGRAEEAISLYTAAFAGSRIVTMDRYGAEDGPMAGKVRHATIELGGQQLQVIDSPPVHDFTFTPSVSLHVACDTAAEVDALFARLSEGGKVMMPLDAYPFSARYAWFSDRFGVSWQLALRTR
jgi:predicted 3-demethylubiquinone-9 3-methyltransferase (glyoxalase superfamily)